MDDPGGYIIFPSSSGFVLGLSYVVMLFVLSLSVSLLFSIIYVSVFSLLPETIEIIPNAKRRIRLLALLDKPKYLKATLRFAIVMGNIGMIMAFWMFWESYFSENLPFLLVVVLQILGDVFLLLLADDILPRTLSKKIGISFSLFFAPIISVLVWLLTPFTWLFVRLSTAVDIRREKNTKSISVENISEAIELASDENYDAEDTKMLRGIAHFGSLDVSTIMTPRSDVAMLRRDVSFDEVLHFILANGYSRIPVYRETTDRIDGILFIKDMLAHIHSGADFLWQTLIRKPLYVPEGKKIDDLLKEFQTQKVHMALVVDEYGAFKGVVTLEDIIEEIVGEINDEYDEDDVDYYKMNEQNYIFAGKTSLNDFVRILGLDLDYFGTLGQESESLAGVVLELAGRIPARNETVTYQNLKFRIMNSDNRRINRIKVSIMEDKASLSHLSGMLPLAVVVLALSFLLGCGGNNDPIPRPKGYYEIVLPEKKYQTYDSLCPFRFEYPVYASIRPFTKNLSKPCWFNIVFPQFRATLHMSYENVGGNFEKFSDDQHELAYKHTSRANGIDEIRIESPSEKVWGIIYDIEGDAASNYQFHVTDSQKHLLRGSLYFDFKANTDSVAPVLTFLKKDVMRLVETVTWK